MESKKKKVEYKMKNNIISIETHLGTLIINLNNIDIIDIMKDCGCIFIIYNGKKYRISEESYCNLINNTEKM